MHLQGHRSPAGLSGMCVCICIDIESGLARRYFNAPPFRKGGGMGMGFLYAKRGENIAWRAVMVFWVLEDLFIAGLVGHVTRQITEETFKIISQELHVPALRMILQAKSLA